MNEIYSQVLVIGVDAGGTRSRAYLAEGGPDGAVLGRGSGGPGNALSVGRAELTRHLTAAIAAAVPTGARARVAAVFGGFAGSAAGLGPDRGGGLALSCLEDALAANGITDAAVDVGGDTEVALAAAPGAPADGLVLIAGTGAIATRLTGRRRSAAADGNGWLLGDDGGGYWLGRQAVRAALAALDGRGPWTSLVAKVGAHYLGEGGAPPPSRAAGPKAGSSDAGSSDVSRGRTGRGAARVAGPHSGAADVAGHVAGDRTDAWAVSPASGSEARDRVGRAIVGRAYAQAPPMLALLSPAVVEAAGEGDVVGSRLLDEAGDLLAVGVRALAPRPGEPLVTTGGLLGPGGPLLDRVSVRLDDLGLRLFPVVDGGRGAAALARLLL